MGSRQSRTPVVSVGVSSSAPASPSCRGAPRTAWQGSQSEPVMLRRRGASPRAGAAGSAPHLLRADDSAALLPGTPRSSYASAHATTPRRFAVVGRTVNRRTQRAEASRRPPVVLGAASPVCVGRLAGSTSQPARRALLGPQRTRPHTFPVGAAASQPALGGLVHEDDDADMWDAALPALPAVHGDAASRLVAMTSSEDDVGESTRGDGCMPGHATLLDRLLPELHTRVASVYGQGHGGRATPSAATSARSLHAAAAGGGDAWVSRAVSLAPVSDRGCDATLMRPITALPGQTQRGNSGAGAGAGAGQPTPPAAGATLPPLRPVRVPPVRSPGASSTSSPDWGLAPSSSSAPKSSLEHGSSSSSPGGDAGDEGANAGAGGARLAVLRAPVLRATGVLAGTCVDSMSEQAHGIFSRGTGFFVAPYVDTAGAAAATPAVALPSPPVRFEGSSSESPSDWWQQLSRPAYGMIRVHSDASGEECDPRSGSGDDDDSRSVRPRAGSPLLEDAPGPQRSTSSSSVQAEGAAWLQHAAATPMRPPQHDGAPSLSAPASFRVPRRELGPPVPLRRTFSETLASPPSAAARHAAPASTIADSLDAMERAMRQQDEQRQLHRHVAGHTAFSALLANRLSTLSSATEDKSSSTAPAASRTGSSECYSVTVVVA